mgnify:CR=1 FL=1
MQASDRKCISVLLLGILTGQIPSYILYHPTISFFHHNIFHNTDVDIWAKCGTWGVCAVFVEKPEAYGKRVRYLIVYNKETRKMSKTTAMGGKDWKKKGVVRVNSTYAGIFNKAGMCSSTWGGEKSGKDGDTSCMDGQFYNCYSMTTTTITALY